MTGAAFDVEFELKGADEARRKLKEAADRHAHPAPLFDAVGAMLVASTIDRFERETDPEGNPWPASIRVQLEGGKTLTDSGNLRNSLTHEANDEGVAVGTNVPYAATHQFGATIRPVNALALAFELGGQTVFARQVTIPRRAFLGIDHEDELAIIDIAAEFLAEPIGASNAAH